VGLEVFLGDEALREGRREGGREGGGVRTR